MLSAIPLLSIVLLLANLVAFGAQTGFAESLFALTLPSGGTVSFSTGDGLILLGLALLYALVELLIAPKFAHAAFFALTAMCLIDVIAGFTVTIASARRDFAPANQG